MATNTTNGNTKFWLLDGDTPTGGAIKIKVEVRTAPSWTSFPRWYDVAYKQDGGMSEWCIVAGFVSKADVAGYLVGRLGVNPTEAQKVME